MKRAVTLATFGTLGVFAALAAACAPGVPRADPRVVVVPAASSDSGAPATLGDADIAPRDHAGSEAWPFQVVARPGGLCVRADGRLRCGSLTAEGALTEVDPVTSSLTDVTSVTTGRTFVCVSTTRGTVSCAGDNRWGELGARSRVEKSDAFLEVPGLTGVRRVVAGGMHACAILRNGGVECWGQNERGQTGSDTNYLSEARELVGPEPVSSVVNAIDVAATNLTTCAIESGRPNEVVCWGATDQHGGEGAPPATRASLRGLDDISASESAFCGVNAGRVLCFGDASNFVSREVARGTGAEPIDVGLKNARRVRISYGHGCALLEGGRVACFGMGYSHALGHEVPDDVYEPQAPAIVEGLPPVVDVTVSSSLSCATTAGREVYCWGAVGAWDRYQIRPVRIRYE